MDVNHNFNTWQNNNKGRRDVSDFEMKVYQFVSQIPIGKVATYKQVAVAIGHPNACRAVGTALSKNPFADPSGNFYVPCHRVINSNFKVGGFLGVTVSTSSQQASSYGSTQHAISSEPKLKQQILQSEGILITNGAISNLPQYRNLITTF